MNLAELTKRQRDAAMRQQLNDPAKGIIISEGSDGTGSVANPAAPGWNSIQNKPASYPPASHTFISHSDVPLSYTGQAGKALIVKATEDGLEFGQAGGGSGIFDYGLITEDAGTPQDWGTLT